MCGIPAAGILAQQLLEKLLNKDGYKQRNVTPGFWTHDWRPVRLSLCIDGFGVTYFGKEHAKQIMVFLSKSYKILSDW